MLNHLAHVAHFHYGQSSSLDINMMAVIKLNEVKPRVWLVSQ